ncbi:hypothetical protein [Sediminibacterium sp.]|uniref:hypothetical protein n=1 Tax=Sediminibacterium sp. TaxID=1917865 RepID=UPI0025D9F02F|nr:hypothetical protein [Sediminibacterium sp.]MBW0177303.1 hypothetical protein [Sediminibacterium sp.]
MKKFQILGTVLLLSVVTTLLVACQKEQDGVTNEASAKSEESIVAVEVNAANIPGMISKDAAASMAAEYAKLFSNSRNTKYTQSVTFDIKDLQNFLSVLKRKGGKSVTVNFGVYNEKTAHDPSQVGRLTVFFTGSSQARGNIRNSDISDILSRVEEFLNGGQLVP